MQEQSFSNAPENPLERRSFLTSSLALSALAMANQSWSQSPAAKPREYFELRKYYLQSGPQVALTESYISDALIPALNRLGITPVGVFRLTIGPETPTIYLLLPSTSLETLTTAEQHLVRDAQFMKAAEPFWNAPATAPAFLRVESSLLIAFEGRPKLMLPPKTEHPDQRIIQLRTYESATNQDHVRKIEMFHNGEFEIFQKAGFTPVFFGDTLIGPRLPNLTYMLSFPDVTVLNARWEAFRNDPEWKKLSGAPRYQFESIVSNISNLMLTPTSFSQI